MASGVDSDTVDVEVSAEGAEFCLYTALTGSAFRLVIDPFRVPKRSVERMLKYLLRGRIRLILRVIHHNRDIARSTSTRVPSGPIVVIFCHGGVGAESRICGSPRDIATRFDRVVKVAIGENRAVLSIPGTTERALPSNRQ